MLYSVTKKTEEKFGKIKNGFETFASQSGKAIKKKVDEISANYKLKPLNVNEKENQKQIKQMSEAKMNINV